MEEEPQSLKGLIRQVLEIAWRRKSCLLPFPILAALVFYYVHSLPPIYRSEGVIMVENQNIPQDLVRTTVTSYAAQQMQIIRQQIESTGSVLSIVNKHGLYEGPVEVDPIQIVSRFRENMDVAAINAEIMDPEAGRKRTVSIAFRVSFQDQSPLLAQKVTSELIQLFLERNAAARSEEAQQTSSFLRNEADVLQKRVVAIEDKIAAFKSENSDSLPELLEYNLDVIATSEARINQNQISIANLTEQEQLLSIELRSLDPYTGAPVGSAVTPGNQGPQNINVVLANKKTELANLSTRYSDSHPTIMALTRDIKTLEEQILVSRQSQNIGSDQDFEDSLFHPTYLQLRYRIGSVERDIANLVAENKKLTAQIADFNSRISRTYIVQREFDELQRDYQATYVRYEQLRAAQYDAEVAQSLEEGSQSESLRLTEAASEPKFPVGPDRPKTLIMGLGAAAAFCIGLGALLEFLDDRVRGARQFKNLIGSEPLASIPYIYTPAEFIRTKKIRKRIFYLLIGIPIFLIILAALFAMLFYGEVLDGSSEDLLTNSYLQSASRALGG